MNKILLGAGALLGLVLLIPKPKMNSALVAEGASLPAAPTSGWNTQAEALGANVYNQLVQLFKEYLLSEGAETDEIRGQWAYLKDSYNDSLSAVSKLPSEQATVALFEQMKKAQDIAERVF